MTQYFDVLLKTKLFQSLTEEKLSFLLDQLEAKVRIYEKNETIIASHEPFSNVCILVEGSAHIMKAQVSGNSLLLSELEKGDMFAESYVFARSHNLPVSVVATSECKVMLLDFHHFIHTSAYDENTVWLLHRMLTIIANKNVALNERMELLNQRTMRDKILLYLRLLSREEKNKSITIPFSRMELADYLGVDRSALSRELSQMQKDGLIRYEGRVFSLMNK